jgi:hypothetical protein
MSFPDRRLPRAALTGLALVLVASLAGCGKGESRREAGFAPMAMGKMVMMATPPMPAAAPADGAKLAYSHQLSLDMAAASIPPRFERARDACLKNPGLGCILLNASIDRGGPDAPPSANLSVRLPHASVAGFERDLVQPVAGEAAGDARVQSLSTSAEDLSPRLADLGLRLAQLQDFRDRLTALAKRSDAQVDDLIKIEQSLSETQSQIEGLTAEQSGLDQQVATELLNVSMSARPDLDLLGAPIAAAWRDASAILGQSTALALQTLIAAIPWLVLAVPVLAILWAIAARLRRRR